MKKLLLFFFSVALVTGAVSAQTTAKQEEKKDLRDAIKDKRVHQKAVVKNTANLNMDAAHSEHEKAEAARLKQHAIAKDLKAQGEKHSVRKAKKIIHKQHEAAEEKKEAAAKKNG